VTQWSKSVFGKVAAIVYSAWSNYLFKAFAILYGAKYSMVILFYG